MRATTSSGQRTALAARSSAARKLRSKWRAPGSARRLPGGSPPVAGCRRSAPPSGSPAGGPAPRRSRAWSVAHAGLPGAYDARLDGVLEQRALQLPARPEEPGLHRAHRHAERLRNLRISQPLDVAQRHHLAEFLRQRVDGGQDPVVHQRRGRTRPPGPSRHARGTSACGSATSRSTWTGARRRRR